MDEPGSSRLRPQPIMFAPGDYIVQQHSPWPVMLVLGTRYNDLQRQVYVVRT